MVKKIVIHNHFYGDSKKSAIQKKKAYQKSYWNHSKRELHRKHLKRVCSIMEKYRVHAEGCEKAYRYLAKNYLEKYFTKFQGPLNITPNTIALSIAYIVYWGCGMYDEFSKLVHIKEITLNKAAKILEPQYFKD